MIASHVFHGSCPGPHILFFGAIHGEEVCGPIALDKLLQQLESGELSLQKGTVTIVPIANNYAYKQKARYVDQDLNRIFCFHENPSCEEERIANALLPLVDACDILVDIHSTWTKSSPFVFQDYLSDSCQELAQSTQIPIILQWWPELFEDAGTSDTVQYAHAQGKIGIVAECWQHQDQDAACVAYGVIRNVLSHYDFLPEDVSREVGIPERILYRMTHAVIKEKEWWLIKILDHEEKVSKGQKLIAYNDGTFFSSPDDLYVIMPTPIEKQKIGEKVFYLARKNIFR